MKSGRPRTDARRRELSRFKLLLGGLAKVPKIYNLRHGNVPPGAVKIDRSTKWGNPFVIENESDRPWAIAKFLSWLETQPELVRDAMVELKGKDLACWCAPKACHGDVWIGIANHELINELRERREEEENG